MCMIIDTNTISCVFSSDNNKHNDFKPVLKWFLYDKAKIILGGKLLTKELSEKHLQRFLPLMKEFALLNKIHYISNEQVDLKEEEIKSKEKNKDFDDPHIIALAILSKAKIICSDDSRSFKFIKKMKEYDNNCIIPKIYTSIDHSPHTELLCEENICSNGEHKVLSKSIADKLWGKIEETDKT